MDIVNQFYDAERIYSTLPKDTPEAAREKARQDWLSVLADEDFTLSQSPDLPWGGVYRGHKGFQDWIDAIHKWVTKIDVEPIDILSNPAGDLAIVWMTVNWTLRSTGEDVSAPMAQVWEIDAKRRKVVGLRPFYWNVKGFKERMGAPP